MKFTLSIAWRSDKTAVFVASRSVKVSLVVCFVVVVVFVTTVLDWDCATGGLPCATALPSTGVDIVGFGVVVADKNGT